MAISVDRIYQTVQRRLNIEQRGQFPPVDFNYFANLAQLDLFNKIFTDKAHYMVSQKGRNSPLPDELQEKIDVFVVRNASLPQVVGANGRFPLPDDLYMLQTLYYRPTRGNRVIVEQMDHKMSNYILNSSLTGASLLFPKYERYNSTSKGIGEIEVYPNTITSIIAEYIKQPSQPKWTFMNISGTAVFNSSANDANDFDLHPSMEDDLISKVLYYAASSTRQEDVAQAALAEMSSEEQIERN